ncbi:MAG: hypothetical protein M1838_005987 [Thelocarpon superellum]|nr:MAG: hypothetical protein M1838_005987 [Thelocarpon superellum]
MASPDVPAPAEKSSPSPSRSTSNRRPRAPTITIDTSATVDPSAADRSATASSDDDATVAVRSPPDLKPSSSFESKNSRPTSGHHISSPSAKANDTHFLVVPSLRSRRSSVDSDDGTQTTTLTGVDPPLQTTSLNILNHGAANDEIMNAQDALNPDPGTEGDFSVPDNKFAFSPGQMTKLMNPKSLSAFYAVGGLAGLEKGLRTDRQAGLSSDELALDGCVSFRDATSRTNTSDDSNDAPPRRMKRSATGSTARSFRKRADDSFLDRRRVFTANRLPERKVKSIFQLAWIAYNDKVLILLTIAAVISLALGLYQTFGQPSTNGEPQVEWVDGVAIMAAVIIVVVVGAANDWQKERQFVKLNRKKESGNVKVIRSGRSQEISIYDVMVGDVMHLAPGDVVPVDGIFIQGFGIRCDESHATGESDLLRKTPADDVAHALESHEDVRKMDPFIISGSKVTEGVGTFLVTAVGINSSYGKILVSLREGTETTPLQKKLNTLAEQIAKLGGAAALVLFVVLFIKFLVKLPHDTDPPSMKGQNFLQILIVAVTIVVVAVPEGLPLAVTLALAFATTQMLKDNNLVRVLRACETMGNATTVCSDKTGTLTQNKMTVVAGTVGKTSRFGDKKLGLDESMDSPAKGKSIAGSEDAEEISTRIGELSAREVVTTLSHDVKELLVQSIAINSTAFEGDADGQPSYVGSKTETALLSFARDHLGMGQLGEVRANAEVVQFVPFDSGRKCMGSVVKLDDGTFRMYVKGAAEIVLATCARIIPHPTHELSEVPISVDDSDYLNRLIEGYASRSLRTIALVYRDFEQWPPKDARTVEEDARQARFQDVFRNMVFLGLVGIQDPLREGVPDAVRTCQKAGVYVRMVTGDNLLTARAIAEECGIYTPGGVVMEGPAFRKLGRSEMDQVIPRLQVLARSSPEDKRILVKRLKELGETVAVTGDGTNDAPALKTADVGFSMGIAGTEVAKEASSIILMDDNFSSIIKAIMWGRAVNDSVKKFLQFQVTVNITAVVLAFVSAVSNDQEASVLTAVQLLWVNLIMDTFAALALATQPPTRTILDRKPEPKTAPLISITMWKMIICQAIYQLGITFLIYFGGTTILSYGSEREQLQLPTLVFNVFVWMQIFNQLNCRRLDNKFNVLEGLTSNYFFIAINVIMIGGQVIICFFGGAAFSIHRLNTAQWLYSLILGALSIPIGVLIRLIPDAAFAKLIPQRIHRKHAPPPQPQVVVSDEDQRFEWNQALEEIREELTFLKRVRGGRLNALAFKLQNPREAILPRSRTRSRSSSIAPQTPSGLTSASEVGLSVPNTPDSRSRRRDRSRSNSAFGPAAAMAGIVAGSIAGWSPIERAHGDGESVRFSRSITRSELEDPEGIEIHPQTKTDDPIVIEPRPNLTQPPSQVPGLAPSYGDTLDAPGSHTKL